MTSQHGLRKFFDQIKPFSKLFISPRYARVTSKVVEPELRLKDYLNDDYMDKVKKSLLARGDRRNGLNEIDFKQLKVNVSELVSRKEQVRSLWKDEDKSELVEQHKERICDLEQLVVPVLLRLPNLFNEDEVPTVGYDDQILKQTNTRYYDFKLLDAKRISYINELRKSSILGPHCEYLLGKGAQMSLALQKYFRKTIQQTFPEQTGRGFTYRHLHEVDGMDFLKSALIEAGNDYDALNFENDNLQLDLDERRDAQQLHLVGSCSNESMLSLLIKRQTVPKYLPARFLQFGSSYEQNLRQVNTVLLFSLVEKDFEISNNELKRIEQLIWNLYEPFNLPIRLRRLNVKRLQFTEYNRVELDVYFPHSREWRPIAHYSHYSDYLPYRVHCTEHHCLGGKLTNLNLLLDAILENHQTETGKLEIPDCIANHM